MERRKEREGEPLQFFSFFKNIFNWIEIDLVLSPPSFIKGMSVEDSYEEYE